MPEKISVTFRNLYMKSNNDIWRHEVETGITTAKLHYSNVTLPCRPPPINNMQIVK